MSHYGPAAAASRGNGPRPNRRPPFGGGGPPQLPPPPPPRHPYEQSHHRRQELPPPPPPPPPPRNQFPHHGMPIVQGRTQMLSSHHGNNNFSMQNLMHNAHMNGVPPPPPPPPPPHDQQRMNSNNFTPQLPTGQQLRQHPARGMVSYPNAPAAGHMFHPGNAPVMQQQQQQQVFRQGGGPPQMFHPVHQQQQQRPHPVVVNLQQAPPHHSVSQHQSLPPSTIQNQTHPASVLPTVANLPRPAPQSQIPPVTSPSTQKYSTQTQSNVSEPSDSSNAWAEHTSPTGVPYYYNSITGVSTYDRPASLPPTNISSSTADKSRVWKTYTDESTGKKYYSDGFTTTWNRPAELPDEVTLVKTASIKRVSIAEEALAHKKRKKGKEDEEALYANKAEAIAAFKGLLLAKDIAPNAKWNDVVRICSDDPRWEACTTIGERKQALAEYQTKRSNELRDVKRHEKLRAKEAYQRLLTDVLSESSHDFSSPGASCRFGDVRELLSKDDRFHAVEDEATREELFYDFVEELRKREERTKRNKKREAKEGFLTLLRLYEEKGKLSFASTWTSFLSQLDENEKNDPKFMVSENMSDSDRQLFFADFVIQLQMAEDEKQRRILEARQRAEKAQRDAYRSRLHEMAKAGIIRPGTRWRSVEDKLACDPSYPPVYAQRRETPRELFEDFVDEWNDEYRRERAVLNRTLGLANGKFMFGENTTLDEFKKKLLELSSPMPDLYSEIRRILIRDDALSSCWIFFNERMAEYKADNGHCEGQILDGEESSEDEGEIIELK